ncbi:c-type cytochrome domain-containing protein [Planctomycetaceae bacterium SH139]
MRNLKLVAFIACGCASSLLSARLLAAKEPFDVFLEQHCLRCHGPELVERDLRIDLLSRDFQSGADGHLWAEVVERINAGEMPPPDEPRPTEDEIASVVEQLDLRIRQGQAG